MVSIPSKMLECLEVKIPDEFANSWHVYLLHEESSSQVLFLKVPKEHIRDCSTICTAEPLMVVG